MKSPNGKPIIRWSFSPSLQISDWSWGSQIDRTFGIPIAQAARTRRQHLGRGKETRSTVAMGFCSCTFAAWDWPPLPVPAGLVLLLCCPNPLSILCSTGKPQQLFPTKLPADPSPSITAGDSPSPRGPFSRLTCFSFPAWVAAPQLFPSLSSTTILVNQRCSLLRWFDSKFSHFLLDRVRVTHPQPTPRASCTATGWLMRKGTCIPQKGMNCLRPWQDKDSACSQGC